MATKISKATQEELTALGEKLQKARAEVALLEDAVSSVSRRVIDLDTWPKRLVLDVSVGKHSEQTVEFGREECGFEAGSAEENELRYEFGNLYAYFDVDAKGHAFLVGMADTTRDIYLGDTYTESSIQRSLGRKQ